MKKIISIVSACSLLVFVTGCLKDKPANDFASTAKPIVEYGITSSGTSHGLEGFAADALLTAGQTDPIVLPIVVNVASVYPLNTDLKVTLAIDDGLRTTYNSTGGVQFAQMPDSTYAFTVTTGVIKAGSRLDTFYVTFYPTKIDPTQNYMLPIKIADASGQTISGNFSVAYFHTIGNPLAGNYTWDFYRWNATDSLGALSGLSFFGATATFLPDDPTTVEAQSGYYTQRNYVITFDNNGGVLSNFAVTPGAQMLSDFSSAGITITNGPTLTIADPVTGHYRVRMITASRFLVDDYYK